MFLAANWGSHVLIFLMWACPSWITDSMLSARCANVRCNLANLVGFIRRIVVLSA